MQRPHNLGPHDLEERDLRQPVAPRTDTPSWRLPVIGGLLLVGIVAAAVLPRLRAREALEHETAQLAVPVVAVEKPSAAPVAHELALPAVVRGFQEAPIFARTSGYLRRWYFDIGSRVQQGQLLAEIEAPEVGQQLRQARSDLATAQATQRLSRITAERSAGLYKEQAIAKQDADNAAGDLAAKTALVASAEANVKRLEDLQSYQKVYAPFAGVITARNVDVGALIDAGGGGGSRAELFHIAETSTLRVYVNLPEVYAPLAKQGLSVDLTVREFPDRHFKGTLVRNAGAIDATTRTLLVEVDFDNADGTLLPGAYAQVHFQLPSDAKILRVPASSLMFRSEGLRLAVVLPNQHVRLTPVSIGRDLGTQVEISSGLDGSENIIANPPDSLLDGQLVRLATPEANGTQPAH
jgi:RND family efflux transporter MFP subunit